MRKSPQGFVGVVTVLVVSVITLALAVTATFLAVDEVLFSFGADQSQQAFHLADGCLEEGSYRVKRDPTYTGGTIPYTGNTCTLVVSGGGSTRTVTSTVVIGDYTRTVQSEISLVNNVAGNANGIDVTQWAEQ